MKLAFGVALFLPAISLSVQAQNPTPGVPAGPLVKAAPEFAHWVVSVRATASRGGSDLRGDPASNNESAVEPQEAEARQKQGSERVEAIRTGEVELKTISSRGGTQKVWIIGGVRVVMPREGERPSVQLMGTELTPQRDFPELNWISAKAFQGMAKLNERECLVFNGKTLNIEDVEIPATAYIDAESRLPLAFKTTEQERTYRYLPAPTTVLDPPQVAKDASAVWRKKLEKFGGGKPAPPR